MILFLALGQPFIISPPTHTSRANHSHLTGNQNIQPLLVAPSSHLTCYRFFQILLGFGGWWLVIFVGFLFAIWFFYLAWRFFVLFSCFAFQKAAFRNINHKKIAGESWAALLRGYGSEKEACVVIKMEILNGRALCWGGFLCVMVGMESFRVFLSWWVMDLVCNWSYEWLIWWVIDLMSKWYGE